MYSNLLKTLIFSDIDIIYLIPVQNDHIEKNLKKESVHQLYWNILLIASDTLLNECWKVQLLFS